MCDERERLIGYVYDEVDDGERQRVSAHLASCEVCREEISGLRTVREDLLAWDVPVYESVWKPFAPARPVPWWREVPAWAMAAAASLTFLVGAAGGVVTHALVTGEPAMAAGTPVVQTVPAGLSDAELSAIERRVMQRLRADLLAQPAAQSTAAPALPADLARTSDLSALEGRVVDFLDRALVSFSNDMGSTHDRLDDVEQKIKTLSAGYQGPGNY